MQHRSSSRSWSSERRKFLRQGGGLPLSSWAAPWLAFACGSSETDLENSVFSSLPDATAAGASGASVNNLVTRSVSGHLTDKMQEEYTTVWAPLQRRAIGAVMR